MADHDVLASALKETEDDFMAALDHRLLRSPAAYMDAYHRLFRLTYGHCFADARELPVHDEIRSKMYERLRVCVDTRVKGVVGYKCTTMQGAESLDLRRIQRCYVPG